MSTRGEQAPSTVSLLLASGVPAALIATMVFSLLAMAGAGAHHLADDLRSGLGVSERVARDFARDVIHRRQREALIVDALTMVVFAWVAVWRHRRMGDISFRRRPEQRARLVVGAVLGVLLCSFVAAPLWFAAFYVAG